MTLDCGGVLLLQLDSSIVIVTLQLKLLLLDRQLN